MTACPALRELEVFLWHLDQPSAPLAHLTRLCLFMPDPPQNGAPLLRRLADAAPRLEVFDCSKRNLDCGTAAAVEGHPCLRELHLFMFSTAWARAVQRLPALSNLLLTVPASLLEDEGMEGHAPGIGCALRVCGWLAPCKRLMHLELKVGGTTMPALELLAAVGAAVGGRLLTSTLYNVELLPTRDAAARALYTLVACYPHLEVLTLWEDWKMEESAAEALARELLAAAPVVAPFCPALRKVRVKYRDIRPDGTAKTAICTARTGVLLKRSLYAAVRSPQGAPKEDLRIGGALLGRRLRRAKEE